MKVKVDIWMDYACPFCYIGHKEFQNAVEAAGFEDKVEVNYKAFQLDREAPEKPFKKEKDALVEKYASLSQVDEMQKAILERGEKLGLEYNFDEIMSQNTFKAHVIYKLAKEKGLGEEYQDIAFKALFAEGKFLADEEVLIDLVKEIGIEADEVKSALDKDSEYVHDVRTDLLQANHYKLSGVPFFVFNDKYSIQGAQSQGMFERVLKHTEDEMINGPKEE